MGNDSPIPTNTMNVAAPDGTPPRRFNSRHDSLKNCLAQRGLDEAAERPHPRWDISRTKFNNISKPYEMTKSELPGAGKDTPPDH